ncbi:retrovirus-related pol polyprotein from transposon TNT 1-94 [Tanacetum coccineum]
MGYSTRECGDCSEMTVRGCCPTRAGHKHCHLAYVPDPLKLDELVPVYVSDNSMEEDDDEDPEEDPSEKHEPEDDDDDDDTNDEDEEPTEEEEEEHLAPADMTCNKRSNGCKLSTSANTKFSNQSTLEKPSLQPLRNHLPPKVGELNDLSNPVTSNSVTSTKESKVMKNDKVIAPEMFRINPFQTSREEKYVPNKPIKASGRSNLFMVRRLGMLKAYDRKSEASHKFRPMRVESINGKQNFLVIVDDYSHYTWVHFLKSKDVAPEEMKTFLKKITILLQAPVIIAKAIATACYTQNRSIIHCRFNKTPYELINGKKPDISSLHVFGALCYPQNDREDIGNLGAKAMAFEQRSSKPELQGMNSGQISSRLDLTYAPSTITSQKTTECELDLLVEAIYSKHFTDVDELQQQHVQQQDDPAPLQPEAVADNIPNAMFDRNTFVNPFAPPSISLAESSSQHDGSYQDIFGLHYTQIVHCIPNRRENAFLHGSLKEGVYVCQPEGFIDTDHPSHVYKLKKAIYGLKQAPKAWYDELSKFLQHNHFNKGTIDPTLFIRRFNDDILVVQFYVDDIFFVNQSPCGIFINQSNYVLEILKKYGMETCDPIGTPMEIKDKLDLDKNGTLVNATKYRSMIGALMYLTSNADYAGCRDSFKSTFGGTQFLGEKLVGWSSKKLDCTALSTAELEYVSLSACCAQVIWMQTQLTDYGFHFNKIPIYCDSKLAIAIS